MQIAAGNADRYEPAEGIRNTLADDGRRLTKPQPHPARRGISGATMKGEAQREKLAVAATELADAQADARVESLRDPMNNLTDRRAKRP